MPKGISKLLSSQESSLQSKKHITKGKGISPLLATVLLIAMTVVTTTLLSQWVTTTMSSTQTTVTNRTNEGVACAAAEIVIDDVYITSGSTSETASVILRNSGMTDDLTITSAQLYNKNGDNITATNVPISNFDRGTTSTLSFRFKPAGDSSKYGNNGTINGSIVLASGRYGSAMESDRMPINNALIDTMTTQNMNLTANNLTLEAWIKATDGYAGGFLGKANSTHYEFILALYDGMIVLNSGECELYDFPVGGLRYINDSQWHHAVGIINSSTLVTYLDGVKDSNKTCDTTRNLTGSTIKLGVRERATWYWNGSLDDMAIWNRSLNGTEINTSMNQGPLSVSNTNDLVGYWNFDGGIVTCPSDFSRVVVTTNCGGVSAEFSKSPKC